MNTSIAFIPWSKDYEIGHELIDSQHKIFLMIFNKLGQNISTGYTREHMFRVINELKRYAEFHFVSEENLMYESGYPDLNNHQHIHSDILLELNALEVAVSQGYSKPEDIYFFLKGWLFNHILGEDSKIVDFIDSQD
jgi:hemerythrin-like metal-binding domain